MSKNYRSVCMYCKQWGNAYTATADWINAPDQQPTQDPYASCSQSPNGKHFYVWERDDI